LIGAPFKFLPAVTSRLIVCYAWVHLILLALLGRKIKSNKDFIFIGGFYYLYFIWVFINSGLSGFRDTEILISVVLMFFQASIGGIFFAYIFNRMDISFREMILWVQTVILLHSIFIILFFISFDFKQLVFNYLPEKVGNLDFTEELTRSRGLNTSGAVLSLMQSFGFMFTAYLISTVKHNSKQFYYLLFSFGIIFISVFITGRTGLLIIPVMIIYLLVILIAKKKLKKNIIYFLISIPVLGVVFYFMFKLGYRYILGGAVTVHGEDVFDHLVRWVVTEFITRDGNISSKTVQTLFGRMWIFPDSWNVILRGDVTTWDVNRIPSDVGYIRMLFGTGLIGIFLFYTLFLLLFLKIILMSSGIEEKGMFVFLTGFLFIADLKEPFLNGISINTFFVLFFWYLTIRNSNIKNHGVIT
jgi:hypothetical protein